MIEEIVTSSAVINKHHDGDGQTSEGVQTLDSPGLFSCGLRGLHQVDGVLLLPRLPQVGSHQSVARPELEPDQEPPGCGCPVERLVGQPHSHQQAEDGERPEDGKESIDRSEILQVGKVEELISLVNSPGLHRDITVGQIQMINTELFEVMGSLTDRGLVQVLNLQLCWVAGLDLNTNTLSKSNQREVSQSLPESWH